MNHFDQRPATQIAIDLPGCADGAWEEGQGEHNRLQGQKSSMPITPGRTHCVISLRCSERVNLSGFCSS
jgi:hypothetical protein